MAGQIDLSGVFAAAFGPVYGDGYLHRVTRADDEGGDVAATETSVAIKGQVDQVSEAYRASAGYADKQQRLIVLRAGVSPPITTDDQITLGGIRWLIAAVETDPANTHFLIRGQRAA